MQISLIFAHTRANAGSLQTRSTERSSRWSLSRGKKQRRSGHVWEEQEGRHCRLAAHLGPCRNRERTGAGAALVMKPAGQAWPVLGGPGTGDVWADCIHGDASSVAAEREA